MRISTQTIRALTGTNTGTLQDFFLKQGEAKKVPFQIKHNDVAVDITDYVFESELRELTAEYASDGANGFNIVNPAFKANGNVFTLTSNIVVTQANVGNVQFYIPAAVTSTEADLASTVPVMYYGFFSINDGSVPDPEIQKLPILVVINNDGV